MHNNKAPVHIPTISKETNERKATSKKSEHVSLNILTTRILQ